jgi:hypothetical protein
MDATEKLVEAHFVHRGFIDVRYEPDGNVPPDFLVENRIAVEARRLSQIHIGDGTTQSLEEAAIPLFKNIAGLAAESGPPTDGRTWFLHPEFTRPVGRWRPLKRKLRRAMQAFSPDSRSGWTILYSQPGFTLEAFPASTARSRRFLMAGYGDLESGGWMIAELEKSIRHCVSEKWDKVARFRCKYPEWWLALVDHIGYTFDDFDRAVFREQLSIKHDWDRIVLVDPLNPARWFNI